MALNMRQVVNLLRGQGRNVQVYVRRDGGILIKSIDGQRFTGATGNLYARAMTGQTLSTKRATQLARITWGEGQKRPKSYIEDREIKRLLQRVQRRWNKAFPHGQQELPSVGRKTAAKVKWSLQHRGREETIRLLKEAERYASGKAYTKNIETLAMFVEDAGVKYGSEDLMELANSIRENAWLIKEDSISPAYHELYKLNAGASPQDVATNVRRVLQIP